MKERTKNYLRTYVCIMQGRRNVWGREYWPSLYFFILVNPIQIRGSRLFPHHILYSVLFYKKCIYKKQYIRTTKVSVQELTLARTTQIFGNFKKKREEIVVVFWKFKKRLHTTYVSTYVPEWVYANNAWVLIKSHHFL